MTEAHQITLDATVDISAVESLYEDLEKIISSNGAVTIDAAKVERIDTSCMQLLYAFKKQVDVNGYDLHWGPLSENFLEVAALVGLHDLLELTAENDD